MQTRSNTWKQIAAGRKFRCESIAEIDGVTYASISAPIIERGLFPDALSIGNCVAASLQLSIRSDSAIAQAASIVIKTRIVAEDGTAVSEYLPAGTFWVSRRTYDVVNRLTMVTCYDAMLKTNAPYPVGTASGWPKSQQAVVTEIAGLLGVQVDARTVISANAPAIERPKGYTIQEVLGFIGVANAGNWIITKENKLRLVPIVTAPTASSLPADHINLYGVIGRLTTGRNQTVSGVILTNDQDAEEEFTAGSSSGYVITCSAPFASQAVCDAIYAAVGGAVYHPYTAARGVYDPAAELGDPVVRLADPNASITDPNADVNVISHICKETATYGFAFRGDISAPTSAELEDEYPYLGSRGQKGEDGRAIVGQLVTYAESVSASVDPSTLTWSTIMPQVDPGEYLWTRTTFYYSVAPFEEHTYTVSLQGATGVGITAEREYYTVTNSDSVAPDDPETDPTIWTPDTPPTRDAGEFLWRCHKTTYSDGSVVYAAPVCVTGDQGDQGNQGVGIASERDYFTITDSDSEIPDDPDTDPTIWTPDTPPQRGYKEYIWRCHETTYSDGSVVYAAPVCITGDPGDSGLTLIISSDKGSAFNYDAFAELTGDIYDAAGNLVDPDGEEFIIRWWFTQDGKAARYLNGGKSLVIAVNDSLCNYMSDIWFETIPIEESVFPFLLCKRDGTILTSRRGFPLSVAAAERYGV